MKEETTNWKLTHVVDDHSLLEPSEDLRIGMGISRELNGARKGRSELQILAGCSAFRHSLKLRLGRQSMSSRCTLQKHVPPHISAGPHTRKRDH